MFKNQKRSLMLVAVATMLGSTAASADSMKDNRQGGSTPGQLTRLPSVSEYFSQEDDAALRGNWRAPDTVVPVLVESIRYSADEFRTLNGAGARHFVLDENAAQQGVLLGFRTRKALAAYFQSQGRMPSDAPAGEDTTGEVSTMCNWDSYWYEHSNYTGNYLNASAGYGWKNLDSFGWSWRISSVIPTSCGTYAILWDLPFYSGATLYIAANVPAQYLDVYGWNDRARSIGSWQ